MSQRLVELLENNKTIAITSHIDPDADAIASSVLLKTWINQNYPNLETDIFLCGEIEDIYKPLVGNEKINEIDNGKTYDIVFVLDSPNPERTGFEDLIKKSDNIINIDHHETNTHFGNYNILPCQLSSTGEILFRMLDKTKPITDKKIAELAFHSMITDTACFSSLTFSRKTKEVLVQLKSFDVDFVKIKNYYFTISDSKKYLIRKALRSMDYYVDDRVSYMFISKEDLKNSGGEFTDTLGIVDKGLKADGVDIAIIVIEKEDGSFHVSLRGKPNVNVAEIALNMGGGGHDTMAAFQFKGNFELVKARLISQCTIALEHISAQDYEIDNELMKM